MVSEVEEDEGGVGELELEGRLRMRMVGWKAPGGGDRTERGDVADGEITRAGMGFGDLEFLWRQSAGALIASMDDVHARILPYTLVVFFI
jgi:hypothetical protein